VYDFHNKYSLYIVLNAVDVPLRNCSDTDQRGIKLQRY